MIKVLHLMTATEENKGVGGAETLLLAMLKNIDKTRFHFTIAYATKGVLKKDFEAAGAEVIPFDSHMHLDIAAVLKLRKMIKDRKIDVLHSHQPRLDLFGAIACKLTGRPMVFTRHLAISESPIGSFKKHIFISFDKITLASAVKIVCASKSIADDLEAVEKADRRKIEVIYAGLDLRVYDTGIEKGSIRKEFSIPADAPLIGMIGRINAQKSHQYFIMAASEVLKEEPKSRFFIVGDGPLRQEQERLAKSLGVETNVIFTGFRTDIPQIIADLDISALSSLTEALAVVNIEAMAMEKPVVSFDVGGVSELVINGKTGFLIPPKDWKSFARAIIELIRDKQKALQMGLSGRRRAEEMFSLDIMVHKHEKLYSEIAQNKATSD